MLESIRNQLIDDLKSGQIIPYLGPGALAGSVNPATGDPIPADSNSLILAMNNGVAMAPKLMYEFPRAAMNQELKRGRSYVNKFLTKLYGDTEWTHPPLYDWLLELKPPMIIDINRDLHLQNSYASLPHYLIHGVARLAYELRFKIFRHDGVKYQEITQEAFDPISLPVLFKPMGSPVPEANFIASDADYVDYITELMGGFAIPTPLKAYRKGRQYLLIGLRLNRDTERMVMSDITFDAGTPRGWALIADASDKERRFCAKIGLEVIDASPEQLMGIEVEPPDVSEIGC